MYAFPHAGKERKGILTKKLEDRPLLKDAGHCSCSVRTIQDPIRVT